MTLRGVEIAHPEFRELTDQDADMLLAWGATAARFAVSTHLWLSDSCDWSPEYRERVRNTVRRLTERGITAIIKHNRSTNNKSCGREPYLSPLSDERGLVLWTGLAKEFGNNSLVIFDLWNEPHDVTAAEWKWGRKFGTWPNRWRGVGMQELAVHVRRLAPSTPLLISGTAWAAQLACHRTHPIYVPGTLMAGMHCYHDKGGGALPHTMETRFDNCELPVIMSEFGHKRTLSSAVAFMQNVIDWCESKGAGWIAFSWSVGNEWGLLENWNYRPTPAGLVVKNALAGRNV